MSDNKNDGLMPNKKQPIVPVFKAKEAFSGEEIEGDFYYDQDFKEWNISRRDYCKENFIKPETLQMSLDGKEWYSMERIEELIELGLQYEWAIESLAKENDTNEKFEGGLK